MILVSLQTNQISGYPLTPQISFPGMLLVKCCKLLPHLLLRIAATKVYINNFTVFSILLKPVLSVQYF